MNICAYAYVHKICICRYYGITELSILRNCCGIIVDISKGYMLVSKIFAMLRLYNARHVALVTRSSKRSSIILESDFRNIERVSCCRYTKSANTTSTSNNENKGPETNRLSLENLPV
ncbi:uncharacterized protein LOC132757503 [Ruditapes philippinarum]|uniref:uncharacterized protein LOC132757503 n=1 Tax=Ruditapes philippinarum TaxID=129788 RepID=UPI00295B96D8|nr:uncharacterized protein LOC132757503 [Ruditapes philippinarum]